VYVYASDDVVIFATALHILESVDAVPRTMSVRGVIELAVFECTLSTRTPFAGIERLHAAELLRFDRTSSSRRQYWHWDGVQPSQHETRDVARLAHEQFMRAVELRMDRTREATAFLSGGVDARCVVAALRSVDVSVDAHTFADPGTQERAFAAEFAAAAGVRHHLHAMPQGKLDWSGMIAAVTSDATPDRDARVARLVWSGDGGSVGVGHVQVTPQIVELMRRNDARAACRQFLVQEHKRIPDRLFASAAIGNSQDLLLRGMLEELQRVPDAEPGRRFHLFLMLNDQRNHLWRHFEGLLRHRIELVTPFFDADFVATVLTAKLDDCLGHRFYYQWMEFFDDVVRRVPWQSYPGHLPCPVVIAEPLRDQWDASWTRARNRDARSMILRRGAGVVLRPGFPTVLRRSAMAMAVLATGLRIRDYHYALETGILVEEYWRRAGGALAPQ
jgi:asparagine synthetase B (glutamine-hydrolysing)